MYGEQARFFDDEIRPTIKHSKKGLVAMAGASAGLTQVAHQIGVFHIPHVCTCTEGSMGNHIHIAHRILIAAGAGENMNASQFYFTLGPNLDSLDEKHTIFGEVHIHQVLKVMLPPLHTEVSLGIRSQLKARMTFWGVYLCQSMCVLHTWGREVSQCDLQVTAALKRWLPGFMHGSVPCRRPEG